MLASVDCTNEDSYETHSEGELPLQVEYFKRAHTLEDFQDFFTMEELEELEEPQCK